MWTILRSSLIVSHWVPLPEAGAPEMMICTAAGSHTSRRCDGGGARGGEEKWRGGEEDGRTLGLRVASIRTAEREAEGRSEAGARVAARGAETLPSERAGAAGGMGWGRGVGGGLSRGGDGVGRFWEGYCGENDRDEWRLSE